jgi:hypothetical protein
MEKVKMKKSGTYWREEINRYCAADAELRAVKQLVTIAGLLHSINMQDWIERNSLHQ